MAIKGLKPWELLTSVLVCPQSSLSSLPTQPHPVSRTHHTGSCFRNTAPGVLSASDPFPQSHTPEPCSPCIAPSASRSHKPPQVPFLKSSLARKPHPISQTLGTVYISSSLSGNAGSWGSGPLPHSPLNVFFPLLLVRRSSSLLALQKVSFCHHLL